MKTALPLLLFGAGLNVAAQTSATFAYGTILSNNCSAITAWNGITDAYPQDMGTVCFNFYPNPLSGMDIPWQLGFPNNGLLPNETPFTWGAQLFNSGNATTNGSTFSQYGTAFYSDYGVTVSVTANFLVHVSKSCNRGVCRTYVTNTLTGGTGTVSTP